MPCATHDKFRLRSDKGIIADMVLPRSENWRDLERIASVIEGALQDNAKVSLNRRLPELQTGSLRECDVTIESGTEQRPFLSIVEVQDRSRPVNIGTFEGWLSKRDALGAHQLICVSRHAYPDSVFQKARVDGRVRLVSFSSLERANWPVLLQMHPIKFVYRSIAGILDFDIHQLDVEEGEVVEYQPAAISSLEQRFSVTPEGPLLPLKNVLSEHFNDCLESVPSTSGTHLVTFSTAGRPLWMQLNDRMRTVRVDGSVHVKGVSEDLAPEVFSYSQQAPANPDAWLVTATALVDSNEYQLEMMMKPDTEHTWKFAVTRIWGMRPGDEFRLGLTNPERGEQPVAGHLKDGVDEGCQRE